MGQGADIDTQRCPLCGNSNGCAMAAAAAAGSVAVPPCWCSDVRIAPAMLARIPEGARARACICPACAATTPQPEVREP